jgi:hypothetical protein
MNIKTLSRNNNPKKFNLTDRLPQDDHLGRERKTN